MHDASATGRLRADHAAGRQPGQDGGGAEPTFGRPAGRELPTNPSVVCIQRCWEAEVLHGDGDCRWRRPNSLHQVPANGFPLSFHGRSIHSTMNRSPHAGPVDERRNLVLEDGLLVFDPETSFPDRVLGPSCFRLRCVFFSSHAVFFSTFMHYFEQSFLRRNILQQPRIFSRTRKIFFWTIGVFF